MKKKAIRSRVQLDMPTSIKNAAKSVAIDRDQTLVDFVLESMAKNGDRKLKKLVDEHLNEK